MANSESMERPDNGLSGTTWLGNLTRYLRFIDEENRRPSQHGGSVLERRLFYWHRHQRSSFRNGLLTRERRAHLDKFLPGWDRPGIKKEPSA